jgi:hypothetical protein
MSLGWKIAFWLVALVWSAGYGVYNRAAFHFADDTVKKPDGSPWDDTHWSLRLMRWRWSPYSVFLFLSNFVCCFAGWVAFYFLLTRRLPSSALSATDLAIGVFAVLGITGYLPRLLPKFGDIIKLG